MLTTQFTCPNGHSFTANAKLRARCPDCGSMARKSFNEPVVVKPSVESKAPIKETKETPLAKTKRVVKAATPEPIKKSIKIIRKGRTPEPIKVESSNMPKKTVKSTDKKQLVSQKMVKHATIPIVRGQPTGNREHKINPDNKPYWQKVQETYWSR